MSESNQLVETQDQDKSIGRPYAAHQRLLAEIDTVPTTSLTPITLDVPSVVTTALGVLSEIKPF